MSNPHSEPAPPDAKAIPPYITEALALRDQIYRLRGKIVSDVNAMELSVDRILCVYFGANDPKLRFQIRVLRRIQLAEKLKIIDEIVDELELKSRLEETLSRLRRVLDIRNDQAHSNVDFNMADLGNPELLEWQSMRVTRRAVQTTRIAIEELEESAAFVGSVGSEVMRIFVGVLAWRDGGDPATSIDEFEVANPHVYARATDPRR